MDAVPGEVRRGGEREAARAALRRQRAVLAAALRAQVALAAHTLALLQVAGGKVSLFYLTNLVRLCVC